MKARTLVGKDLRLEFSDGRVFPNPANFDYTGGSQPVVNDLLLAGSDPELCGYGVTPEGETPPGEPTCYPLLGPTHSTGTQIYKTVRMRAARPSHLSLDRLLSGKDFGRDEDKLFGVKTCINDAGQAFAQRPATAYG